MEQTESGDNWTVIVFKSPSKAWPDVLIELFSLLENLEGAEIPHFTIRRLEAGQDRWLTVSLRILRNQAFAEPIGERLSHFMEEHQLPYSIDPKSGDYLECHAWIKKGETNPHWTRRLCETLSKLSRLVCSLAKDSQFGPDNRSEWAHLIVNMLGFQEAVIVGPQDIVSEGWIAAYFDLITGSVFGPYRTTIVHRNLRQD